MTTIVQIAFWLTVVITPIAWFTAVVSGILALMNRKPGVRLWADAPFSNPFNHILVADHLTERGLRHRRRLFCSIAAFVVPFIVMVLLAAITGELR